MNRNEPIELTTRELHDLITPVLPHASTDKDLSGLGVIRLEVREGVLYAVASDRFTMAVTRHRLREPAADAAIAIGREDAAALLKLFKYGRDEDPELQLIVGTVEAETVLDPADRPALTVTAKDGNTLVLHGHEGKPLTSWRKMIGKIIHREHRPAPPSLALNPLLLARWSKAMRGRDPLAVFFGPNATDPIVVKAEDHFIGIWMPAKRSDGRSDVLTNSLWLKEVPLEADSSEAATAKQSEAAK